MPLTFEERVSEELDALYAGAVFLCGGDGARAHELVIESVRLASSELQGRAGGDSFTRWMEQLLVRSTLDAIEADRVESQAEGKEGPAANAVDGPGDLRWMQVARAAGNMSVRARVAVWLVTLRRWSYDEVEATMGIGRDTLRELLAHRTELFSAASAGSSGGEVGGMGR